MLKDEGRLLQSVSEFLLARLFSSGCLAEEEALLIPAQGDERIERSRIDSKTLFGQRVTPAPAKLRRMISMKDYLRAVVRSRD